MRKYIVKEEVVSGQTCYSLWRNDWYDKEFLGIYGDKEAAIKAAKRLAAPTYTVRTVFEISSEDGAD